MTDAFWQALPDTGAVADLSDHVRLRLTGPDAVRYLNGQVTQDVRKLRPGHALPACVTNHKGKLEAFVHLTTDPTGALFISGPGDLRDFLPLRLEKYLIADDCVLEDLTESTALVHLIAPLEKLTPLLTESEIPAALPRFGPPGYDLWITPERLPFWLAQFPRLSPEDQSTLEVLHGVPAWGHELTPDLLPPEAGLDATAIDYHKGCYIGQEVISRIRSVGRVNRRLTALVQTEGPPVERGLSVRPGNPSQSIGQSPFPAVGQITRSALHPHTGHRHALAFLHRNTPDGPLVGGPDDGPALAVLQVRKSLDD
jgi:folate-binding protein YgfZ